MKSRCPRGTPRRSLISAIVAAAVGRTHRTSRSRARSVEGMVSVSKDKHQCQTARKETKTHVSGNQQITVEVWVCSCGKEIGQFVVDRKNLN